MQGQVSQQRRAAHEHFWVHLTLASRHRRAACEQGSFDAGVTAQEGL